MRTPPDRLDEDTLACLIEREWQISVAGLHYAPVGFGDHHWIATGDTGDRLFVTLHELPADEVGRTASHTGVGRALGTARSLHDVAGHPFVVAPLPTRSNDVACLLETGKLVAVYPFVRGQHPTEDGPPEVVRLLASLHATDTASTPLVRVEDFAVPQRDRLDAALARLDQPWETGPHGEATRALIAKNASGVRQLLRRYDALAADARTGRAGWVVTHGEPKADNLLVTPDGLRLIDWDTVLVAPAARDLWMVDDADDTAILRYTEASGRLVSGDELQLYRLKWDLTDLAEYTGWFLRPHQQTPDTEIAWASVQRILHRDEQWRELC